MESSEDVITERTLDEIKFHELFTYDEHSESNKIGEHWNSYEQKL